MARGRPKEVVDQEVISKAKTELKASPDYRVGIRLQAIASCGEHSLAVVSSVLGISRQTIWRWIKRFREEGVQGLYDKPKGHNPAKLTPDRRREIGAWLEKGRNSRGEEVHWTLPRLIEEIRREFGVSITKTPLWVMIHKMGFSQKGPFPPPHPKASQRSPKADKKIPGQGG